MNIIDFLPADSMRRAATGPDGPEFSGACPGCGGEDRFRAWPEHSSGAIGGRYYCRRCDATGDGIDFLRRFQGMDFKEAKAALGVGAVQSARQGKSPQKSPGRQPDTKQEEQWTKAAHLAERMYAACGDSIGHAYLDAKGVSPCQGIRALSGEAVYLYGKEKGPKFTKAIEQVEGTGLLIGGMVFFVWDIVVPLHQMDESGGLKLTTLQFINEQGQKSLLPGGRKQGASFTIPAIHGMEDGPLCIAEGLATALSINQATGHETIMGVDAGNLLPVAMAARRRWPDRPIVICADDDADTPGNPGVTKAQQATAAIGAALYILKSRKKL